MSNEILWVAPYLLALKQFHTEILLFMVFMAGLSGFFLNYRLNFKVTLGNRLTPLISIAIGVGSAYILPDFGKGIIFFTAAVAQFISFVFVSNLRQRGSFFWHAMASLASNGTWYITLHILKGGGVYWMYLFPFMAGVIAGRTIGVLWAQYVIKKFDLKADATRDDRLVPGKRLRFVAIEPIFWVLTASLLCYTLYGFLSFESALRNSLLVVIGLSVLQSLFYALNTRAVQRGNNKYIALTSIASGVMFYVNAVYLLSQNMPFVLFIPYMISTTLGSTLGAFFSMIIEWKAGISPDQHLENKPKTASVKSNAPYFVMAALALVWILANEQIFAFLGYEVSQLKFPFPIQGFDSLPRILIICSASLIFFLDSSLHTVTSRAGNRNHAGYHVSACLPKGAVDFSKLGYLALNSKIPDIVPIAILAGCLGSLFGKDVSERIEKWLKARMDIVDEGTPAVSPIPQK